MPPAEAGAGTGWHGARGATAFRSRSASKFTWFSHNARKRRICAIVESGLGHQQSFAYFLSDRKNKQKQELQPLSLHHVSPTMHKKERPDSHGLHTGFHMASIKQYGDMWRAFVCVGGTRRTRVLRTKREATAWASATETELRERGALSNSERFTLADALTRYAAEVSPGKRGRRWEEIRIAALLRGGALPVGLPMGQVTTAHMAAWRDARLVDVSAGSVLREISLLSSVFEVARKEWGWLPVNPLRDMGKPRHPDHREAIISLRQTLRSSH